MKPNSFSNDAGRGQCGMREQYDEFFPSEPAANVGRADGLDDNPGQMLQHFIADLMTVRIVNGFETVYVHDDEAKGRLL
ncbi:hypothetical protein D3C76_1840830 [compost metagenome]